MKNIYIISLKASDMNKVIIDADDLKVIFMNDRLISIDNTTIKVIKAEIGSQFQITGDSDKGNYETEYMGHI